MLFGCVLNLFCCVFLCVLCLFLMFSGFVLCECECDVNDLFCMMFELVFVVVYIVMFLCVC